MKALIEYLKLIFTKWYFYLGFLPGFLDLVTVYLPEKYQFNVPLIYSWIFLCIVFIYVNFQIWKEARQRNKFPKVIIDYDLSAFNVIYLEVKNIGNDYARNINIKFNPNIEDKQSQKINSKNFLKNISQLSPNKSIRFFFGSFLDKKYLQKFIVDITYNDLDEKQKFTEKQVIDFSSFIGSSPQKKDSDEIVNELKNVSKHLESQSDNSQKTNEILKNGINIRNLGLDVCSLKELSTLLKNIIKMGNKEDLWLNPYIYDIRYIIKALRDKLFSKEILNKEDKIVLEQLNILHKYQFHLGENKKFNDTIKKIEKLL